MSAHPASAPTARALRASLVGLFSALLGVLVGCAVERCPPTRPLASLPPSLAARVEISRESRPSAVRDAGAAPIEVHLPRLVRVRTGVAWDAGRERGVSVPMHRAGRLWSVDASVVAVDGRRAELPGLRIDTGLAGTMSLSSFDAVRSGLTLIEEIGPGQSFTAFGPRPARFGVLTALDLGPAELTPVGAQVECDGPGFEPLLGLETLEAFGHAIFDWERERLILLPRGSVGRTASLAADPRWASTPWSDGTVRTRRDSLADRGAGRREVTLTGAGRWATVSIAGRDHIAAIDTGFSGEVFSFEPLGLDRRHAAPSTDAWTASGFGRSADFAARELDAPVRLAGVYFPGASALVPDRSPADFAQRGGIDLVIGLGILERHPLWLDFERDRLSVWTSDDPLPRVPGVTP